MIFTITMSVLLSILTAGYIGNVQKNHFELVCNQIDYRFVQESVDAYRLVYNRTIAIDTTKFETLIDTFFAKNFPDSDIDIYYYFYNTKTGENDVDTNNECDGVQMKIVYTNLLTNYSVEKGFEVSKNPLIEE